MQNDKTVIEGLIDSWWNESDRNNDLIQIGLLEEGKLNDLVVSLHYYLSCAMAVSRFRSGKIEHTQPALEAEQQRLSSLTICNFIATELMAGSEAVA